MNKPRKVELAWWATKVRQQALMYADLADPKRTHTDDLSPKLDKIAAMCRDIHFEITGKLPEDAH